MRYESEPDECPGCGFPIAACECADLYAETPIYADIPDSEPDHSRPKAGYEIWETLPREDIRTITDRELALVERAHSRGSQEIGGAADADLELISDVDEDTEIPDEHILETTGLLSHVDGPDRETVGHIYMTEWDNVDDAFIPLSLAEQKPGLSILLESSPRSYHLYNLSVREFSEQTRDAAAGTGDLGHVRWAARRGYFALRILGKFHTESGEEYKPAPSIISVFNSASKFPQSKPHLEFFRDMARDDGRDDLADQIDEATHDHDLAGESLEVDHYQTITDEWKESIGRGK